MDMPIEKNTFLEIEDPKSRDAIIYDIQKGNRQILCEIQNEVKCMNKTLNKNKNIDKATSFGGGIIGGIMAVAGKWVFFGK